MVLGSVGVTVVCVTKRGSWACPRNAGSHGPLCLLVPLWVAFLLFLGGVGGLPSATPATGREGAEAPGSWSRGEKKSVMQPLGACACPPRTLGG